MSHAQRGGNVNDGWRRGRVVASHGRHVWVEALDDGDGLAIGQRVLCHPRGKKNAAVVGDWVRWLPSQDEGTIERIDERRNLLYRQDDVRSKQFAANIDQVLILVAAEPEFSEHQLTRALIAAEEAHIAPLIVCNKADLGELFERAWARLEPYRAMDYRVLPLSLRAGIGMSDVQAALHGQHTLVLGPSGVGKSTLVNALVPHADAQTAEISQALNSGKHTTTHTTWYWVDDHHETALLDSPGFQSFGLHHIDPAQLAAYMPDLKPHVEHCKFYNCTHLHEPQCGVQDAVARGDISPTRHRIYSELYAELTQPQYGR